MPRKPRPLDRPSKVRDASLIIIASEDRYAVDVYFREFRTTRTQVIPLPTEDCNSSPRDIIERLDKFKEDFAVVDGDQFWYCGDTDHWVEPNHIANLCEVLQHCRAKQYGIALNNPCFELWLLLHFSNVEPTTALTCSEVDSRLSEVAGGYSKRFGCHKRPTAEMVHAAVSRAKSLPGSLEQIRNGPGSGVFQIIESLLRRDSIDLGEGSIQAGACGSL